MNRLPVMLIKDESQARLILDPMRREILRQLSLRAQTQKDLSETLGISAPSVAHHLKALLRGRLISVGREEIGIHGIARKWYSSNAEAFIVDRDHLRNDIRRYFMAVDIERTRGMIAAMSVLRGLEVPTTSQMETLTRRFCSAMCRIAQNHNSVAEGDPERTIHKIYVEALRELQFENLDNKEDSVPGRPLRPRYPRFALPGLSIPR